MTTDTKPRDPESHSSEPESAQALALDRRSFLGTAGKLAVGAVAAGAAQLVPSEAGAALPWDPIGTYRDREFTKRTLGYRIERANANYYSTPVPAHLNNGDEARYPNKIGSDTRGLPHDQYGEVDLKAWKQLVFALESQRESELEKVTLGGTRKLAHPLGALALNTTGIAQPQHYIPPAPALESAEKTAEAVESYWQALLRDVPFWEYSNDTKNELVLAAVAELDKLPGYTGPRDSSGRVTPELLFRGTARYRDPSDRTGRRAKSVAPPGVTVGPYISQFIYRSVPYGVQSVSGLLRIPVAGSVNEFLTTQEEWLANQDGRPVTRSITFSSTPRYLSTGRDLAEYAHGGSPAFWAAALILGASVAQGGIGAPLHKNNPYLKLTKSSSGIGTFGLGYIQGLIPLSSTREIRANYWQKWYVHRSIRPEAYGGLVHHLLVTGKDYPLPDAILDSEALDRTFEKQGTYFYPGAFPEGAPNHSSYPGGASSVGSVNATILKAFFDENFVIPNPVQPDPSDPTKLIPYVGPPLTVGGELNKLATNLGQGRNWAGIHWRSDAAGSLPHAEEVAIGILRDERNSYRESFDGFEFTGFDGSLIKI